MIVFLGIMIVLLFLSILLVVLPVRVFFRLDGSTFGGFDMHGRIMVYGGVVGVGMLSERNRRFVQLFAGGRRLFQYDVTSLLSKVRIPRKKEKGAEAEKKKAGRESRSLTERIGGKVRGIKRYAGFARECLGMIRDIVRFDRVDTEIDLGFFNPALTGWISGLIFAVNQVLPARFTIVPRYCFSDVVFGGTASVGLTIRMHMLWRHAYGFYSVIKRVSKHEENHSKTLVMQEG
ncbi:MAG: hypothetical protein J7M24_07570 [Candidatus Latescibacteria bacterium]|nr:hypothetical protein [Candidatus Latescibacterota bacterium]